MNYKKGLLMKGNSQIGKWLKKYKQTKTCRNKTNERSLKMKVSDIMEINSLLEKKNDFECLLNRGEIYIQDEHTIIRIELREKDSYYESFANWIKQEISKIDNRLSELGITED